MNVLPSLRIWRRQGLSSTTSSKSLRNSDMMDMIEEEDEA